MELTRKIMLSLLLVATLLFPLGIRGQNDIPTLEALIDAHKKMKKAEDLAVLELTTITATHSLTEKVTTAYNKTRTILNKRMSDTNSYIMLVSQLSNVTLKMVGLIENYSDFTSGTYKLAQDKPFVMAYYIRANLELKNEIKFLSQMISTYAASGLNLLKATMKEKYQVLAQIDISISKMNRLINRTNLICKGMVKTGVREWHVKELAESSKYIVKEIIELWQQRQ